MNTPKSQNPAGKVVASLCNFMDEDGGITTRLRPRGEAMNLPLGEYDLYLHPATALADMQADREMLVADCQESRERAEKHWRRAEDAERDRDAMQRRLEADRLNAERFRYLSAWWDGLKSSRSESFLDLLGVPDEDITAPFGDIVDAYANGVDSPDRTLLRGDGKGDGEAT